MVDITELLKGTVPEVTAQLGELTAEELQLAHDDEETGKARRTLLDAIHAEQGNRAEAAALQAQFDNAREVLTKDASADAKFAALMNLAAAAKVDLPRPDDLAYALERIAALEAKLDMPPVEPAEQPEPGNVPVLIELYDPEGDAPATDGLFIAFTDANDMTLAALPRLGFGREQFRFVGNSATLLPEILLPETGPRTNVEKVWLLDDEGRGLASVTLMAPLPAGGGQTGRFGPQSLLFMREDVAPAPQPEG